MSGVLADKEIRYADLLRFEPGAATPLPQRLLSFISDEIGESGESVMRCGVN
jgi:hypothetical protein